MLEIRIHGYGGQGTVTLAELIAYAQLKLGRYVQTLSFFGMERRGAPVKTAMRLSEREILLRSQVYQPDVLVVLSEGLAQASLQQGLHSRGVLLLNCSDDREPAEAGGVYRQENDHGDQRPEEKGIVPVCSVDAWGIARAQELVLMGQPLINIPMFGAMSRLLGISREAVEESLAYKWPGAGNEKTIRAALQGYENLRGTEAMPSAEEWKGRMSA